MESHRVCETCGLIVDGDELHQDKDECIKRLRVAMLKQKQAAERIGMDISVHFLRALEELSIRPDVGFRYTILNPETGEQQILPPQHVSGVFASLLKVYREQSDFKSDEQQRKIATHWAWVAGQIGGLLQTFMDRYEIEDADKVEALALLERVAVDDGTGPGIVELQEELRAEQGLNVRMMNLLVEVEKQAFRTGTMTDPEFAAELTAILHPEENSPGQPDQEGSQSPEG